MKNKNLVTVAGTIKYPYKEITLNNGKRLFATKMESKRLSGQFDEIPLIIPEDLIGMPWNDEGVNVTITGEFLSRNIDGHLELYLFAKTVEYDMEDWQNNISFEGYICKPPFYRKTPLGRDIADLLIAVNRDNGKSSYLPCIVWGSNATWAKDNLNVGDKIECIGRIQSREYTKNNEPRIAYEVSISKIWKGANKDESDS